MIGPSDGDMAVFGAILGFLLGVMFIVSGAPWWTLPLTVILSAFLAVAA